MGCIKSNRKTSNLLKVKSSMLNIIISQHPVVFGKCLVWKCHFDILSERLITRLNSHHLLMLFWSKFRVSGLIHQHNPKVCAVLFWANLVLKISKLTVVGLWQLQIFWYYNGSSDCCSFMLKTNQEIPAWQAAAFPWQGMSPFIVFLHSCLIYPLPVHDKVK